MKTSKLFKKSVIIFVTITTIIWSIGMPFALVVPVALATDPPTPQFWINTISPSGGNINTTFAGTIYFSGAVNSNTVSYSAATADSTSSVFLLEGRYNDYRYFDTWMQNNPDLLTKSTVDVEALRVQVNANDSSRLDLDLTSGTLTAGATYTILIKNVCASGHTATGDNYWQYCPMRFETFTAAGGESTGTAFNTSSMASTTASSLCNGTYARFAGNTNNELYYFNAFGDASLTTVKLYATADPSSTISSVKIYRDKTSNYNTDGNWMLEPGIDTLLGSSSTWAEDGEYYSTTVTLSPALTLPGTDPNGSLGFIAVDIAGDAAVGTSTAPIVQSGSFSFSGTDAATLTTAMNTAIGNFTCASPLINVTSANQQNAPYIQDIAPDTYQTPNATTTSLAVDFWDASGQTSITSMSVSIIVPAGGSFDPQYGLASLVANSPSAGINIYRDNKNSGTQGSYDSADTRIPLSSAPTWTSLTGLSKRATLSFSDGISAPVDNAGANAGADYFVVLRTSSSPAPGSAFQVRIPMDGVVSGFPAANAETKTINIQSGGGMMASTILISEIQPEDSAANDEFVELYNPTNAAVNLSSYSLQYRDATSGTFSKKDFVAGNSVQAYGFFLIAHADYNGTPNEDLTNDGFTMAQAGGTVFLVNNQTILTANTASGATVVDKVAWGTGTLNAEGEAASAPAATQSLERKSWSQCTAADLASGGMDERMGNGEDTNNNFMDFVIQTTEVPQSSASAVENPMEMMMGGGGGTPVVINEVYYYPSSGNTAWVELYNRSTTTQTITGWKVITSSRATSTSTYIFPTFTIGAGSYATVWWKQSGTDTLSDVYTANGAQGSSVTTRLSTLAGDISLTDGSDAYKDYVQYGAVGQPREGTATSTTPVQWVEDNYVPSVIRGQSIGRSGTSGDDRNNAADFQTFSSPTEGSMNSGGDGFAPDPVTSVTLDDLDDCVGANSCNFGLTGQDITITWTPASTDPTFEKYLIYILPAATALSVNTHTPIREIYTGQTTSSFTGQPGLTMDSRNLALVDGDSYRAYVVAQDTAGNRSAAAASAATQLDAEGQGDGDIGADNAMPMIMHMGVWQAQEAKNIVLIARFADDRNLGDVPGVGAQVVWKAAATRAALDMTSGTNTTNCAALEANYYSCTIPSANAVEGQVVGYYLRSEDAIGNLTMMSASPSVDTASYATSNDYETAVQGTPFIIDILADTSYIDGGAVADLTGTVYQSNGSALSGVYVFIEGSAIGTVQTNASGIFSFDDDLIMSGSWPVALFKSSYMDMYGTAFKGEDLTYYMNIGEMHMGATAGMGGYMEMPTIINTNPHDGMFGAPTSNFIMNIGFSKAMDSNTIIDNDAANAGSNIYLTTDGTDRVAGQVSYSSLTNEATFTVTSGTSLSVNTQYTLVVTNRITDTMGNPLSGGWRADGAFEVSFTTMMDNSNMWGTGWGNYMEGGDNYGQAVGGGDYFAGMDFSGYAQGGQQMPPYVAGTTPQPGSSGISKNSSIIVEFSEPMDSSTINTSSILLYPITNESTWQIGDAISATVTLDSAKQKIVTLDPSSDLNLVYSWYQLKVMGNVMSTKGVWMGDPRNCGSTSPTTCLASQSSYEMSFQINTNAATSADATRPRVVGTYPNNNDGISNNLTVDVGIPSLDIGFSEPMNPSTINVQNIVLRTGSKTVTGKVRYDAMDNMARVIPASALLANTQYTLTASTTITDLAGNALDQDTGTAGLQGKTVTFKTGSADIIPPILVSANADDYSMAVTFSEQMNAAKQTDASRWATSVLNPANYLVKTLAMVSGQMAAVDPYRVNGTVEVALTTITGLSFEYDEPTNTVFIEGFNFDSGTPVATSYQLYIDNVTDKSNIAISGSGDRDVNGANATQGPLKNSSETYGMLGPQGGGMMMMGPMGGGGMGMGGSAGGGMAGPGMNMGNMGMMPAGVHPMNMMAGQTSMYFVEFPVTQSIPESGTVVLTFPSGFNVATAAKDTNSPINNDINEWGPGTITYTAASNATARTITLTLGAATQANDFLRMDLKGIVNSPVAKEFGTNGYTVDIKTYNASGVMLESISTMPFYLQESGNYTLSGTVTFAQGNGSVLASNIDNLETFTIFLGSPMTGPMEYEGTFDGTTKTIDYSFTGLPEGQYNLFTDPNITLNVNSTATEFSGLMNPEPIWVNANTVTNNVYDKDLTIRALDSNSGTAVTVTLKGDFRTDSNNDNVDIFANSYNNYRVKTVTPGNVPNGQNYTLYLPDGNWNVGIGKAMPKGPMSGPPPMPDWMSPGPIDVTVASTTVPAVKERSGTANDGTIVFNISSQSLNTITGTVVDGSGNAIASAEVWASQPMGGMGGSFSSTAADGSFTLKVPLLGNYMVGAHKPGLPQGKDKSVDVRSDGNYVNGAQIQSLTITMKKPAYTISGKVLNASSKAVAYAPVWAYQQSSFGNANTQTDSTGNYILYVDAGTWTIEADAPGVGWLQYELPVTISTASQSNINLKPDTNTAWVDISGTVTINNTAQSYMPVSISQYTDSDSDGTPDYYSGREFGGMTDSSGTYSVSVTGGSTATDYKYYEVKIWTPDFGMVGLSTDGVDNSPANIRVANSSVSNANITIAANNLKTTTVQFSNKADYAGRQAFINIEGVTYSNNIPSPNGFHKSTRVADISGADPTVGLVAGDYHFSADVSGYGSYMPSSSSAAFDNTKGCITVDGTGDTVTIALPDLDSANEVITISGTVSGPATGSRDAWVWIGNPATGFNTGINAATSTGAYSLTVPKLSSGSYKIGADKQGYISGGEVTNAGTANTANVNFALTAQTQTISGHIYADISGGTTDTYDSGEGIAYGWLRAKNTSTGAESHAPVDGTGYYSLGISNGIWKLYGAADGYRETQYKVNNTPTTLTISGASLPNTDIELTADANWVSKTKSKPITPSSGGMIDDTAQNTATGKASGTGVKITLPPNALGTDSSAGNVSAVETAAVAATDAMKPFANKGKNITATDNSGQQITSLDNYIDIEMVTYKAEIDEQIASHDIVDEDKLKTMKIGYWDDTAGQWINEPTTKKAYYKKSTDTDWTLYSGTTTDSGFQTGYDKFIDDALDNAPTFIEGTDYDDYKFVLSASVNHLTVYATGLTPDSVAPKAPTALTQSSGNGTSVGLSWTAPTLNADDTALADLYGYAVYRSTDGVTYPQLSQSAILAGTTTYTDTTTTAWTSYYYQVTAGDDDDTESAKSTALQVCSTNSVSNGTVAASCSITCNSGYTQSGNSCVASGGGTGGGTGYTASQPGSTAGAAATPATSNISTGAETVAAPHLAPTTVAKSTVNGSITVSSADGGTTQMTTDAGTIAKVIVPPNAVSTDATFTISQAAVTKTVTGGDTAAASAGASSVPSAPSGSTIVGGKSYTINALSYGTTAVSSFNDSLTLTFTYTDAEVAGINETSLRVHYYNTATNSWTSLTSTVNTETNTITAYTNHLTTFAIMGTPTSDPSVLEGQVVKSASSPAIYLVNQGYLRAFTSEMMYFSYGYKWSDVMVMNIGIIPQGPDMVYSDSHTFTAGQMVKGANEKVYFIDDNGVRHWVQTEATFLGLGYNWKQVAWISDAALAKYTEGDVIASAATRPNGSLVKYASSDKVYLIENGQKRWVKTASAFNAKNYGWYNIIEIPDSEVFVTGYNIN